MDEHTRRDWGRRVRERRHGLLTQEQLAEIIGGDQSTISRIERGAMPSISDQLKWRIAGALHCTVDELFPWPAVRPPFPEREPALA